MVVFDDHLLLYWLPTYRDFVRPTQFNEFDIPGRLAEVQLLQAKYSTDLQQGFSRNDEKTIQFTYLIAVAVDMDGEGHKENVRHLELMLTYDESQGTIENNPHAELLEEKIRCTEPSSADIRTFVDVIPPA